MKLNKIISGLLAAAMIFTMTESVLTAGINDVQVQQEVKNVVKEQASDLRQL
jgi:hypothetical protein